MHYNFEVQQLSAQIIANVRQRRFEQLTQVDEQYRSAFMQWAGKRFVATPNDLEDAWQEALVLFYERVVQGRIISLDCAVSTYLFAVAGRFLLNHQRKMRRFLWEDEATLIMRQQITDQEGWNEHKEILEKAMQQLPDKCLHLLTKRHFYGYKIPEIKEMFGFASENATSVHISNCMRSLKKKIQELMK